MHSASLAPGAALAPPPCIQPVWARLQSVPRLKASGSLAPGAVLTRPEGRQVHAGVTAKHDEGGAALWLSVSPEGPRVWVENGTQTVAIQHSDDVLWQ